MKITYSITALALVALLAGCASTKDVDEMIAAAHRDYTDQIDAHGASIDVLRKSAMTGLAKSKDNGERVTKLEADIVEINERMKVVLGNSEASKMMSAANTVKVGSLSSEVESNHASLMDLTAKLTELDRLYEEVMLGHYKMISESAQAAIESLRASGLSARTNAPVKIDEPIEIVAPDTTSPIQ